MTRAHAPARTATAVCDRNVGAATVVSLVLCAALAIVPQTAHAQGAAPAARDSIHARPLSLDEAVALAERGSPTLRLARNAVLRATGQREQARSGLFPQLNATASYVRTLASQFSGVFGKSSTPARDTLAPVRPPAPPPPCDQYLYGSDTTTFGRVAGLENYARCATAPQTGGIDFSKAGFGSKNTYNLGLTASQNLFTGGRLTGQIAAANATRHSAQVEYTAQRAQLTLDVTQAYYNAALADRLVAIADSTLAQTEAVLRQTRLQAKVGNTSEFDLLRAQVARDNQRPVLIQAQSNRQVAYLRLAQQLNLPLDQPLVLTTPVEDSATGPAGVDLARAMSPDTLTAHRASVREAVDAVKAERGLLKVTRAERIPSLTLSSSYGRIAFPTGFPHWNDFRTNWTVTLATSFPIFTGGRIRGDERIAEANLRDAQARLTQAQQFAALDAREALNALRQAQAAYAASEGTADEAQQAYRIAEVRYQQGISTQVELNDTRNQLAQALVNRAQAARDLQVARVKLALLPDLPVQAAQQVPGGTTIGTSPAAGQGGTMGAPGAAGTSGAPGATGTGQPSSTTGGQGPAGQQPGSNF